MAKEKRVLPESWEEFCEMTGRDPNALPDLSMYEERDKKNAIANFKLPLVIRYCNGAELDYTNKNQLKYEPFWIVKADKDHPSGVGLSFYYYVFWFTHTNCGPRFAFLSPGDLKHVVKYFIELYIDLLL